MSAKSILITVVATMLIASCSKPQEGYAFIDSAPYTFDVPMDSGAVYSIYIACSISPREFGHNRLEAAVNVTSPSGEKFREEICLPVYPDCNSPKDSRMRVTAAGRSCEMEWLYRSNITTTEGGVWKVTVQPQTSFFDGLRGIGLRYNIVSGNERKR